MRKSWFAAAVLGACVAVVPLASGVGVSEDFSGYTVPDPTPTGGDWYYFIGDAQDPFVAYDVNVGLPVRAAYFPLNEAAYSFFSVDPTLGSVVRFETGILDPTLSADWFRSAVGFYDDGVSPASVVNSIGYYIYVDTLLGDGYADSYYISTLSFSGNDDTLETYETLSLVDGTDTWGQYDWDGAAWQHVGDVNTIPLAIRDQTIFAGLEFSLDPLPATGDYMTVFVDDFYLVPEPSALLLACFGAIGVFARRGRRRNA